VYLPIFKAFKNYWYAIHMYTHLTTLLVSPSHHFPIWPILAGSKHDLLTWSRTTQKRRWKGHEAFIYCNTHLQHQVKRSRLIMSVGLFYCFTILIIASKFSGQLRLFGSYRTTYLFLSSLNLPHLTFCAGKHHP
jgi:hypothetical protein